MGDNKPVKSEASKSIGSMYLNAPKDAPDEVKEALEKFRNWMSKNKCYISLSFKRADDGYDKYVAFVNTFKKERKDRDFSIMKSEAGSAVPQKKAAAAKSDDDIPNFL